MLDTPPQDKLNMHLHVLNACEQPCIMMLMRGSKMSKTEYDLKVIMYPAYDIPHKLCNIRGNWNIQQPDFHPILQADPCVSSNAPSLGSSEALGHPLFDFVFSWRGGGGSAWGVIDPDIGISPCANRMGNTPTRHTSTEKYTSENIYARCQSSVGYLAW